MFFEVFIDEHEDTFVLRKALNALGLLFCTTPFFEALTTELPECGRNKGIDRECTTAVTVVRVLGGKFLEVHT